MIKKYFNIAFFCMILCVCVLFSKKGIQVLKHMHDKESNKLTVVIDAGHGGFDPGKVGINNALEKDINLKIALKLKSFLELSDVHVIMTRTDDYGLYDESDKNKKRTDMRKRVDIINSSNAIIAVSIHQNSFPQEKYRGTQVFFYEKSEDGKVLANIIQERVRKSFDDGNKRVAKANDNYYMLKKSACPLVIVECGFLSNSAEAKLLCDDFYQEKMAWAIHMGIMEYVSKKK